MAKRQTLNKSAMGAHRVLSRIASNIDRLMAPTLREQCGMQRGDSIETQVNALIHNALRQPAAPLPASAALPTRYEIWDRYEMAEYGKVGNTFEAGHAARLQVFFDWLLAAALSRADQP